jgi:uncharacterized protein (DUF433 family)
MFVVEALQIPLMQDASGVIRVSGTRIPLETLIMAFRQGDTAEEIAQKYLALNLIDIYTVIAYYLGHQEQADRYIAEQEKETQAVRKEVEARCTPYGIRERLLARQA